jgi:macrocin-O-methyltransferase TylF-like protien
LNAGILVHVQIARQVNRALRPFGLEVHRVQPGEPMRAYQAKPNKRLAYFRHLVGLIDEVPGDIVECGVGTGKTLYMLAALTENGKRPRRVWGFDSFQGLPPPAPEDRPETAPRKIRAGKYAHSREEIEARLLAYGISQRSLDERFILVQASFRTASSATPESRSRYSTSTSTSIARTRTAWNGSSRSSPRAA